MYKREAKNAAFEMAINTLFKIRIGDTEERKKRENAKLAEFLNSLFIGEL
tara:strand:+ start:486 stop:635 length:150 start_codon:yes stop_codon:yes gene_type:complete